ncbi:MAG: hypothetical protein LBE79_04530, partial [Tannerella sp.]|nr:hypothetical protein [Tannerella sp.]
MKNNRIRIIMLLLSPLSVNKEWISIRLAFIFFFCFFPFQTACTQISAPGEFRVMFYNVENLFDTEDDPDTDDNEFTPKGARRWSPRRYYAHLQQTAKVINAIGEWDT